MVGYIKLWRSSVDNKLYFTEPFTHWQAWVDLLLLANYKDSQVLIRGIYVEVKRGQVVAGEEFLAHRWKWSRDKVRRFMSHLESETIQQIRQQKSNVITLITIVNWENYQSDNTTDDTTNKTANNTTEKQQTIQQKNILKNSKEDIRNTKKVYGEFNNILLTEDEYRKLTERFGAADCCRRIDDLSMGISSKGYKYKSHYATILSWDRLEKKRNPTPPTKTESLTLNEKFRIEDAKKVKHDGS
jgi:hypothetical protein